MRLAILATTTWLLLVTTSTAHPQGNRGGGAAAAQAQVEDPVRTLVAMLDLGKYKATILGLTEFGDRRQGTDRNRAAIDWIEARLKSYGCTNTERVKYEYLNQQLRTPGANAGNAPPGAGVAGRGAPGGRGGGGTPNPVKGYTARTGVNANPELQPDPKLRALNAQPDTPGPREEVMPPTIRRPLETG